MGNKRKKSNKTTRRDELRKQCAMMRQRRLLGIRMNNAENSFPNAQSHASTSIGSRCLKILDKPDVQTIMDTEVSSQIEEQALQDEIDLPTCRNQESITDDFEVDDSRDGFVIEPEGYNEEFQAVSGRRIVDLNFIFQQIQNKVHHNNLFDCRAGCFSIVGEKRCGLFSTFKLQCNVCKEIHWINSEDKTSKNVNINIAATTAITATGIGLSQFEELCSAMNIPVFSSKYYQYHLQNIVYNEWEKSAKISMESAAKDEKEMAIAGGCVRNGYPVIDVYVDGSWCARSYGTNYKASSGTAAIIGRRTGKIIYIGVKNKYCLVCAKAKSKDVLPKEHVCYKNYEGASSSMETDILLEGFKSSIEMYGLIYHRMIGDGDASTYAKILNAKPYEDQNITVEKIECRNHVLRNFCKKLRAIQTDTKHLLAHRKTLTNIKIMSMRKAIVKCIKHHKDSQGPKTLAISILHKDILNTFLHAYGDHKMCQKYFCDKESNDNNDYKKIQNSAFAFRIHAIVSSVATKARSMIEDVTTNSVECFNNVIAKFIGGKRINFAQRQGYQARCSGAVLAYNSGKGISSVQSALADNNPKGRIKLLETHRAQKRKYNREHPVKKKRILKDYNKTQHDYGPVSVNPDMSPEELKLAKEDFMKNLQNLTSDRAKIERDMILQRDCSDWLYLRQKLITASNFGAVCKRKVSTNTANLVKNILHKKNLSHVASIAHGVENEKQALQQLQLQEKVEILPCGLFIDRKHSFIGATPDGLIGNDMIVEIKCPITATKLGLAKAIEDNKIQILKYDKKTSTVTINKKSNWFYQIQGQLHITEKKVCLLGIWAGDKEPLHVERIERDDDFWFNCMEEKLVHFYKKCLLPEIVDSRHKRGMPLRNLSLQNKENEQPETRTTNPVSDSENSDEN